ncbi:arginase family protein [Listeria valentina]|uniref:arginase family protein n=1 Tax=Listeria valentina TaxID=2705293 RepID=UPI001AD8C813|nr:arginase family protein [Listeria valentina]
MMQKVGIFGIPWVFSNQRQGTALAPFAIRYTGILEQLANLEIELYDFKNLDVYMEEMLFLSLDLKAITNKMLSQAGLLEGMLRQVDTSLVLAGDEWNALLLLDATQKQNKESVYVVLDAPMQTDFFDSYLGILKKLFEEECLDTADLKIKPAHFCVLSAKRELEKEKSFFEKTGIQYFGLTDIENLGFEEVILRLLAWVHEKNTEVHLLLSASAMDPVFVPGVNQSSFGGLTYREIAYFMRVMAEESSFSTIMIAGLNPLRDEGNKSAKFMARLFEIYFKARTLVDERKLKI